MSETFCIHAGHNQSCCQVCSNARIAELEKERDAFRNANLMNIENHMNQISTLESKLRIAVDLLELLGVDKWPRPQSSPDSEALAIAISEFIKSVRP